MEDLIKAISNIKTNHEKLFLIFRSEDFDIKKLKYTKELEEGLSYLFRIGLARFKAFDIILTYNKSLAYQYLLDLYFHESVTNDIDSNFPFHDLDLLFSQIVEVFGKNELKDFLKHPDVVRVRKKRKRVREAIDFALE